MKKKFDFGPHIAMTFFCEEGMLAKVALAHSAKMSCELEGVPSKEAEDLLFDWVESYGRKKPGPFPLPLKLEGLSSFTRAVLLSLLELPFGTTCSYGGVAEKVGKSGAARAVGAACRTNPFPFVVPCHRVIAADGGMGGYSLGWGIKNELLSFEK